MCRIGVAKKEACETRLELVPSGKSGLHPSRRGERASLLDESRYGRAGLEAVRV